MQEIRDEIEVAAPRERVYELWRDPDTFVEIIGALKDAELEGDTLKWKASGPLGLTMRGEAELVRQEPPDVIAWESTDGALKAIGEVRFHDGTDAGTRVDYKLSYEVIGGAVGNAVAEGLTDPTEQVRDTLERFRALAEQPPGS